MREENRGGPGSPGETISFGSVRYASGLETLTLGGLERKR
jgi:hypothetical protein